MKNNKSDHKLTLIKKEKQQNKKHNIDQTSRLKSKIKVYSLNISCRLYSEVQAKEQNSKLKQHWNMQKEKTTLVNLVDFGKWAKDWFLL